MSGKNFDPNALIQVPVGQLENLMGMIWLLVHQNGGSVIITKDTFLALQPGCQVDQKPTEDGGVEMRALPPTKLTAVQRVGPELQAANDGATEPL